MPTQQQPQTQAVAQQQARPIDLLKTMMNAESVQEQFQNALGKNKETFVASLIDLYTGDKQLQTCKPQLVIAEALRAATMHLPLNKSLGFAYIIVYKNKVKDINGRYLKDEKGNYIKEPIPTFVPGYKGYIQLAMRTGQYLNINDDVVYEGELLGFDKLTGEIKLNGQKKSDKIVGYFCYFELINGFRKSMYMTVEQMAKWAKRYSPSIKYDEKVTVEKLIKQANEEPKSDVVGWNGNFTEMALKTVIRRLLSKYGYLSLEMQEAISRDIESEGTALANRNEAIAEQGNSQVIETEEANYEEVDKDTGEIRQPQPEAPAAPEGSTQQDGTLFNNGGEERPGY